MKLIPLLAIQSMLMSVFAGKTDTLRMIFIGDLMQHSAQTEAARKIAAKSERNESLNTKGKESYDYSGCFRYISSGFEKGDITVANMETAFAGKPYTGYPSFSSPPSFLKAAANAGIDLFLAANNHIGDKGNSGILKTISLFDSLHVRYSGIYRDRTERDVLHPLEIDIKGFRIAILNYTYGTNGVAVKPPLIVNLIDTSEMAADLERCSRTGYDLTVVCIHWGDEYSLKSSPRQEMLAGFLTSRGADVVIGSHPHVPQNITVNKLEPSGDISSIVYYSLGNAISNMSAPYTRIGQMAVIRAVKDTFGRVSLLDPVTEYIWTARPGTFDDNYSIIPVSVFSAKPEAFRIRAEYDNMMYYYSRLKK